MTKCKLFPPIKIFITTLPSLLVFNKFYKYLLTFGNMSVKSEYILFLIFILGDSSYEKFTSKANSIKYDRVDS